MKNKRKPQICFLVSNDLVHDPRVTKEVKSAVNAGFKVLVLGYNPNAKKIGWPKVINKKDYKIILGSFRLDKPIFSISLGANFDLAFRNLRNILLDYLMRIRMFVVEVFSRLKWFKGWSIEQGSQIKRRYFKKIFTQTSIITENAVLVSNKNSKSEPNQPNLFGQINQAHQDFKRNIEKRLETFRFYQKMENFFVKYGVDFCPDIIHANDLDTLYAGYRIKKITGAKLVYDAHEIWVDQGQALPQKLIRKFQKREKFLLNKIDSFLTVNPSLKKEISRMYHHQFKYPTEVVYNCPVYESVTLKKANPKEIKIIFQGRWAYNRGLEELAEATRWLDPRGVILIRATLGDLPVKKNVLSILKKIKTSRAKILQPIDMDRMVQAGKSADIGVIPYLPININNKLSTPNKLFEYMMSGLALAVFDSVELKKFVTKYKNGVVFNPHNPESIAKALNFLIQNPKILLKMRQNSLLTAKEFNWQKEEKKLIRVYQGLIHD